MKKIILFAILSFLFACDTNKPIETSDFYLINKSGKDINIYIYRKNGTKDIDTLNYKNEESRLPEASSTGGFFGILNTDSSLNINTMDSCLVIFNNKDSILHYRYLPKNPFRKYYDNNSKRNMIFPSNYTYSTKSNKNIKHTLITYTFTEQDYLDAKQ
jgi:hypothetical protein